MPSFGMTREHWVQSFGIFASLALTCGTMLAGVTYFIVGHIDSVQATDNAALGQQAQQFNKLLSDQGNLLQTEIRGMQDLLQKSEGEMDHRVTIIEDKNDSYRGALDALTMKLGQIQAAETDLATALAKLSAIEEDRAAMRPRR